MTTDTTTIRGNGFELHGNGRTKFDELYQLFVESGFMPPEKAHLVADHRADIELGFNALQDHSPLLNWVTARDEGGRATGYLSTIWCHRRTTMFQHLSGIRGSRTGGAMVVELMKRTFVEPQFDFVKFYFLADNPYPARIYGSFGEAASDDCTCTMRTVSHVVTSVDAPIGALARDIRVREAAGDDLDWVDEYFADHETPLVRRAEDLTAEALRLDELNRRYQKAGLFRYRHVLVAFRGVQIVGCALVELSSPGLNLSEGLSAFRTFVADDAFGDEDAIRAALVRAAQDIYRRAGRRTVLGLVGVDETPSYVRLGLSAPATSRCILMHRARFEDFAEHVGRLTRWRSRTLVGAAS